MTPCWRPIVNRRWVEFLCCRSLELYVEHAFIDETERLGEQEELDKSIDFHSEHREVEWSVNDLHRLDTPGGGGPSRHDRPDWDTGLVDFVWMVAIQAVNEVAVRAGQVVLERYQAQDTWVRQKADGSPVTGVDLAAEAVIRKGLTGLEPEIPYVSEEYDLPPYEVRRSWNRYWLVDPLDGTKEFINRTDEFTVNIALIEDGEPTLGVVLAPAFGVLYYAQVGKGAWKRDQDGHERRLRSRLADPSRPLRIVESRSHPSPALEVFLEAFTIAERVRSGSSLKFCVVAEGGADVYPRLGPTMEWDVAAGDCVFRCSGQPDPHPSTLTYNKPSLRNGPFVIGLALDTYELPESSR